MDEYPVDLVPQGAVEYVFTTHVTHQQQFFVHLERRSKILDDIMDKLVVRYADLNSEDKPLCSKRLGSLCAAKFTDDDNWYRAKITGLMKNGLIEVQFVDYGNTDYVSEDRIKAIDHDLVQYPVQSYRCSLADVSCSLGFWTPELIIQFEDRVIDKKCKAVFVGEHNEAYLLQMYDSEDNYINKLFGAPDLPENKPVQNGACFDGSFKEMMFEKGTVFDGTVVYVCNPGLFWCQSTAFTNEILILSEELSRLHMTQDIKPLTNVSRGTVCAAKFSEDEAWYRGIVQSVSGNMAKVYFVDFGNTEAVGLDVICNLKPEMRKLPALGIKCCLANVDRKGREWRPETIERFEELALDKECEVKVVAKEGDIYFVTLLDIVENKDVGIQLQSIVDVVKQDKPVHDINSNKQASSAASGIGPSFQIGSKVNVFLSWIENPSDFWVQLSDSEELLEQLSQQLQEVYAKQQPLARPSPGAFVVARFSQDKMWYRGLVLRELEDGQVQVLFIDYGNSDIIPITELRQVAAAFGQVIPLASRCCLVGVKPLHKGDKSWMTDAKDFLEKLTENGCQCEVLNETDSHKLVRLKVGSEDAGKKMIEAGVVADAMSEDRPHFPSFLHEVIVRKSETDDVHVTHVDSPHSFWCQFAKNTSALRDLMKKMQQHYSNKEDTPVKDLVLGQACIVKSSKDNLWYRASLINITPSGYDVHCVDYGNMELVAKVYAPDLRFLDLPTQAFNCSLPITGDLTHLTPILRKATFDTELQLRCLEVLNEIAIVELFDGKMQMSEYLKSVAHSPKQPNFKPPKSIPVGSTIQAFTSVVVSPSRFFIQMSGSDEELGILMDNITLHMSENPPPVVARPHTGQPCVALYSEDSHWYRGRITDAQENECTIVFVDYGNEDTVKLENIRVLTPEMAEVPVMAYECSLDGVQETAWTEKAVQFFESLIMDQELACTFVTPTSVRISCGAQDVAQQLISAGYCTASETVLSQRQSHSNQKRDDESVTNPQQTSSGGFVRRGEGSSEARTYECHDDRDSIRRSGAQQRNDDSYGRKQREVNGVGRSARDSRLEDVHGKDSGLSDGRGHGESRFGSRLNDRKTSDRGSVNARDFTYADTPFESVGAILVHMDDSGIFYIQLPSMEKDILFLSRRLAGSYKGGGPRLRDIPARGTICCARFPLDGNMYRSRIEEVNGSTVIVRYVDYGNTEECSVNDLKFLFPDLVEFPVQAFPCVLRGYNFSIDQAEKFASATLDKDLKVTFTSSTCPFEVDIMTPDGDLLQILTGLCAPPSLIEASGSKPQDSEIGMKSSDTHNNLQKNSASRAKTTEYQTLTSDHSSKTSQSLPKQEFLLPSPPQGALAAFISHIGNDGYFYIQLARDTANLESVAEKLLALPENIQHPNPFKGASCAAIFSEDSAWYRALITDKSGDNLSVLFVDYGNEDSVSTGSVKPLSDELLSYAPLAYKSQFPEMGPLSTEAQSRLAEYLTEHQVTVTFSGKFSPFEVSIMTNDGKDLQEIVCPLTHYPAQIIPSEVLPAGVTHIEKDGRFFLQLFHYYKSIRDLQADINTTCEAGAIEKLESFEIGIPCCVKSENGSWQRGKLNEVTEGCAHVFLVDTGHTVVTDVDSLFTIPPTFLKKPPFALECRLKGVDSWAGDLLDKFTEMTQGKILNATFFSTNPPMRVSLSRSIELDLLGLAAPLPDSPDKSPERRPPSAFTTPEQTEFSLKAEGKSDQNENLETTECIEEPVIVPNTTESIEEPVLVPSTAEIIEEPVIVPSTTASENMELIKSTESVLEPASTEIAEADILSSHRVSVTISYIDSPDKFYIQLSDKKAGLDAMMDEMYEYFSNTPEGFESADDIKAGDICAALYEDGSWYRVKIQSTSDDGTYKIFYMDYGNTENADLGSLCPLPDKFKSNSPWALKATLGGVSPVESSWAEQAVQELKNMVEDRSLLANILDVRECDSEYVVHLLHMGIPVHEELIKKGYAVATEVVAVSTSVQQFFSDNENVESTPEESNACLESTHLEGDNRTARETMMPNEAHSEWKLGCVSNVIKELEDTFVCISYSESPSQFWCQLYEASSTLSQISNSLKAVYSSQTEENTITDPLHVGDIVVVSSENEEFYRAIVVSESPEPTQKLVVRLLDYGRKIETTQNQVLKIHDSLYFWPAQAFQCCLNNIQPVDETWSSDACQKFSTIVNGEKIFLTLVGRDQDGTALVDLVLKDTSESVHSLLVKSGFARETQAEKLAKDLEIPKVMNVSEIETLEITQPLMESTTVTTDVPLRMSPFTFDEAEDGQFRSVKLSLHTEYDVIVTNDELPSSFHIRLLELRDQYLSLMSDIEEHVVSDSCDDSCHFSPEVGDVCLVQHCGVWYRGQVTGLGSDSWNVRSVDCGWEVNVTSSELKSLPAQFRDLPAQAVPCYLAGIVSVEPEWGTDAITFFIDSVSDTDLSLYVLEDADNGKYGVYLSDMNNTASQSVNRAMVDVGYAEVVPGSNIEVQIEMEKTLDTDALDDLEESFSEVSHMRYNAYSGAGREAKCDYENTLGETYEESEVCRTAKMDMDKNLYSLVQIPKSEVASKEIKSEGEPKDCLQLCSDKEVRKTVEFNCASAVEKIDKMGCVDNYPEECLSLVYEDVGETESGESRDTTGTDMNDEGDRVDSDQLKPDLQVEVQQQEESDTKHQNAANEQVLSIGGDTKSEAFGTNELVEIAIPDTDKVDQSSLDGEAGDLEPETESADDNSYLKYEVTSDLPPIHQETNDVPSQERAKDEEQTVDAKGDAPSGTEEIRLEM